MPRLLVSLCAFAFLLGCGDDDVSRCMVLTATGTEPSREAIFGYVEPGFTPYEEGGAYPIIMGMQGGYMTVPMIRIPAEAVDPAEECATLRLRNRLDGEFPLPAFERVFNLQKNGDFYETPLLENFLGFLRGDLIGHELTMTVEITTERFVAAESLSFTMVAPE